MLALVSLLLPYTIMPVVRYFRRMKHENIILFDFETAFKNLCILILKSKPNLEVPEIAPAKRGCGVHP